MKRPEVFYIGDSTVQYNWIDTWPQCGIGQELELYLRPGIRVRDYGRNGRSTRSFREDGFWAPVEEALQPGDFLLIQFGHNDQKDFKPAIYASPEQYAANLLAYANAAKAKGAYPVLITPLVRRHFAPDNRTLLRTHGVYPATMRELAAREGLPLIDLTAASRQLVESLGEEASRELYMVLPAGQYPNFPEGEVDNTHLRYYGAVRFAGLVAEGLRALGAPYADLLLGEAEVDEYDGRRYL